MRLGLYTSLPLLALAACTTPQKDWFIGSATMASDGAIALDLASREKNGPIAHGHFVYPVGHPQYQEILAHIGGIAPGETKQVRPWPDR